VRKNHSRLLLALLLALLVVAGTVGWIRVQASTANPGYPGFATPQAALQTFFASAQKLDYATTYSCYYAAYHERVTQDEFVSHRSKASQLRSYTLGPISASGDTAEATATLVFGASGGQGTATRSVQVHEDLVKEASGWKIRVW
jgi:hypothetical protein